MSKKIITSIATALALMGAFAGQVGAQVTGLTSSSTTPGLPTTGVAGDMFSTVAMVLFSLFLILAGVVYFGTRRA